MHILAWHDILNLYYQSITKSVLLWAEYSYGQSSVKYMCKKGCTAELLRS